MSNVSDSSENATPSSGSRFGRGFMVRIAAVILFLGLGTFAVSQALKAKGDDPEHAHDHDHASDDENGENENSEAALASSENSIQENTRDESPVEKRLVDNTELKKFDPPKFGSFQPKTADRRPSVADRDNKNLVARTPLTTQEGQSTGSRFQVNPGAFPGRNPTTSPVMQVQEKANELKDSIAEKSGNLIAGATQSIGDLKLPNRVGSTPSNPSTTSNQARSPGGLSLNPPGQQTTVPSQPRNSFPAPTNQNPSSRNSATQNLLAQDRSGQGVTTPKNPATRFPLNGNPSTQNLSTQNALAPPRATTPGGLAPLDGPGGLRNTRQESAALPRTPDRGNALPNANSNANSGFNANFNVRGPADQTQRPAAPTNTGNLALNRNPGSQPKSNRTFAPSGTMPTTGPRNFSSQVPNQSNAATNPSVQRSAVPTRQASAVRTLASPAAGTMTRPTPGERALEGARTPSLTVQRIAPREIQLNTAANFEIIVRNVGKVEANDVRVFDQIPTGTELLEASPQPSRDPSGSIQWDIGTLAPGQEKRIKLKLRPTQPGEIGSVAHVSFGTRSSVRTLVTKPVLEITHSAPRKSLVGDQVPLDIVVTNKGNGPANKVIIQEDIPGQLNYADGFRQIEYEVGTLAPGQSRKLQLVLQAAKVGQIRNVIFASADGGLKAQHGVDMEIVAPKLSASSNGPRKRFLRREATHEFQVQNNGTAPATNVELMAKLPQGLKYVSSNNRGQYDPATNAVYWSLAELDAGVAATVSLVTMPVATGDQPISFNAVADLKQKATAEAGLLVEHLADVFFDIDDIVDHIEIGAETKYQLRVVNQGTKTATNVRLQLDLPNGLRPTKVDGGLQSQIQGQRVVFAPITSMNPGDEIKVEVTATGVTAGEHKIVASMQTDGRETSVSKEETTQVYADR